jgi:TPR repeat protein
MAHFCDMRAWAGRSRQSRALMIAVLLLSFIVSRSAVFASPLEDGYAAYTRGDYATALRAWRPLAEGGNTSAQFNLGLMYDKGQGVDQDFREAVKWYRLAAVQGNASAQLNLGLMYHKGQGVDQDFHATVQWFQSAAAQGAVNAQVNLGVMYANGDGISQDFKEAMKWFRLAAVQGDTLAQFRLGLMYERADGGSSGLCTRTYVVQCSCCAGQRRGGQKPR